MNTKPSFLLLPTEVVDGIGPIFAAALKAAGITTIADLMGKSPGRIHQLVPAAGENEVRHWQCAAGLLRVECVTPALAEAFYKAGICSVAELRMAHLKNIEKAAAALGGHRPTIYELSDIQRSAWLLGDQGMLAGRVVDLAGLPIPEVVVELGRYKETTDQNGLFAFESVPEGPAHLQIVSLDRQLPVEIPKINIQPDRLTGPVTLRISRSFRAALPVVHEKDGFPIVYTAGKRMELVWKQTGALAEDDLLQVSELPGKSTGKLLCLYKECLGNIIYISRVKVGANDIPGDVKIGDILVYRGGLLQKTSLTIEDVTALKRRKFQEINRYSKSHIIRLS